jgi:predicted anti-sigma-YlaC factor YlaD
MGDETHQHPGCRELLGDLNAYLDGELESRLCAEIEAHLAECGNCRVVVDTLRGTILLYRQLGQATADLPPDAEQRLFRRLDLGSFER